MDEKLEIVSSVLPDLEIIIFKFLFKFNFNFSDAFKLSINLKFFIILCFKKLYIAFDPKI